MRGAFIVRRQANFLDRAKCSLDVWATVSVVDMKITQPAMSGRLADFHGIEAYFLKMATVRRRRKLEGDPFNANIRDAGCEQPDRRFPCIANIEAESAIQRDPLSVHCRDAEHLLTHPVPQAGDIARLATIEILYQRLVFVIVKCENDLVPTLNVLESS